MGFLQFNLACVEMCFEMFVMDVLIFAEVCGFVDGDLSCSCWIDWFEVGFGLLWAGFVILFLVW